MIRFILISLVFLTACNSRQKPVGTDSSGSVKNDTVVDDTYISTTPVPWAGCYSQVIGKDSAFLKLELVDNSIRGNLVYNRYEKDDNTGTLNNGEIVDDILYADYTFQSEGMTSIREVAFKIKSDTLTEGFGDTNTQGDKVKFKNRSGLKFDSKNAFTKVDCK